jgi:hypothetical protein
MLRATTEHIFSLRQIIEKCVHILFIDFKMAYDSIKHKAIWNALTEFEFHPGMIRMLKVTLKHARSKVRFGGATSESFPNDIGLRRGDGFSTLLLNFVLKTVMRRVMRSTELKKLKRTIYIGQTQILAHTDDIDLLARNEKALKNLFSKLEDHVKAAGLQ